jgi:hypothetical protein
MQYKEVRNSEALWERKGMRDCVGRRSGNKRERPNGLDLNKERGVGRKS